MFIRNTLLNPEQHETSDFFFLILIPEKLSYKHFIKTDWVFGPDSAFSGVSGQSPKALQGSVLSPKLEKATSEEK